MFTGIIEKTGRVTGISGSKSGVRLSIDSGSVFSDVKSGDSIAVNGVCLTVTVINKQVLSFDVIQETLKRSNLGELKLNDQVNLERSLERAFIKLCKIRGVYCAGSREDSVIVNVRHETDSNLFLSRSSFIKVSFIINSKSVGGVTVSESGNTDYREV